MTRSLCRAGAFTFALLLLAGCGLAALDMDFRSGQVRITALDVANAPVAGVGLELLMGDGADGVSSWTGATNASGLASASVMNGEHVLKVAAPQGYVLATGQAGSVPVRVRSEQTTSITVRLQRTP